MILVKLQLLHQIIGLNVLKKKKIMLKCPKEIITKIILIKIKINTQMKMSKFLDNYFSDKTSTLS